MKKHVIVCILTCCVFVLCTRVVFCYEGTTQHIKKLRESAISGNTESCLELGNAYFYGKGVNKDLYSAFQWYFEAAKGNNPAALFNVALCYDQGIGTTVNKIEALRWYKKAASSGVIQAKYNLAMYYKDGAKFPTDSGDIFLEKDVQHSLNLLKECSQSNFPPADRELAKIYMAKTQSKPDFDLGFKLLQRAADNKDPEALFLLSKYKLEHGSELEDVFPMIKESAEHNVAESFEYAGICYETGRGVKQDKDIALKYYKKAAEANIVTSQIRLADSYLNGIIVKHDLNKAIYYYKKAAEQDQPYALFMLGTFADQGIGGSVNKKEALKYFMKSAQLGFAKAQYNIAQYYSEGVLSGKDNDPLAHYWYRKAALQNDPKAQREIGYYYLTGAGVKQSYTYGLSWLELSEKNGDPEARSFMNAIQLN